MIVIKHKGNFEKTTRMLKRMNEFKITNILQKYGEQGVAALSAATPVSSGLTSKSWTYSIEKSEGGYILAWDNSNTNHGVNIALILQTGHGTGTGGYVQGIDYINPALKPVFDQLAEEAWREVTEG